MRIAPNLKDYDYLIGQKRNYLTLVDYYREHKRTYAVCKCDCGNMSTPTMQSFLNGHSKSCGCYFKKVQRERFLTHNMHKTRIYRIFHSMHDRCENPNINTFKHYGARGIKVCDEWSTFEGFRDWAFSNGYTDELSIDRIDVNGDYTPENCRWTTTRVQSLNKTNTRYLTHNGITKTLVEWGEQSVCGVQAFRGRIGAGWDMDRALTEPLYANYSNKKVRRKTT